MTEERRNCAGRVGRVYMTPPLFIQAFENSTLATKRRHKDISLLWPCIIRECDRKIAFSDDDPSSLSIMTFFTKK